MSTDTGPTPPLRADELQRQLEMYAQELHELYWEERHEREALAEEKLVLEYRLKELSALNKLFQRHLNRRIHLEEVLEDAVTRLRDLVTEHPRTAGAASLRGLLDEVDTVLTDPDAPPIRRRVARSRGQVSATRG